ncbi:acetate kinase [Liquorilactobacillus sucicola DSM 21376 = JCM 15457]|uniref:acetate/propionate family kinase n=1 Tax=Liquorilactobacillus sucicola TaxID=519050 RepID=UPI00043336CD|nr:acetate kinase [Liquorilactobacillus sucicola]GAJ26653.1 acetate kinase [Liquorilactobacillus sucicola DSM 21376 = JCM 15457]
MGRILLVNAGSSSVKWKLFESTTEEVVAKGLVERINMPGSIFEVAYGAKKYAENVDNLSYERAASMIFEKLKDLKIIAQLTEIDGIGHRVVAGGQLFRHAVKITEDKLQQLKKLSDFAPLHNPTEIEYIEIMQKALPMIPQYAVFDSQFFTDLPEMNAIYSIPYEYTQKFGIRRYGEHGISHDYISKRAAKLLKKPLSSLKMVTLHLGSGASVAAEKDGKAFDTSMGFTPLTGLTMGTRAGDVDPSVIPYLMKKLDLTVEETLEMLNTKSGLLGVSGISPDMRDYAKQKDDPRVQLTVDIFINRIVKYVGSYFAELGGIDVLVFAGGIGENNVKLRSQVIAKLAALGMEIDPQLNTAGKEGVISSSASKTKIMLVPTNEELSMVRQIKEILD